MDAEIQKLIPIFEAMMDGVYIVNPDYIVEYMNRAMIRDFGDGTGRKCYQVINCSEEICSWCKATTVGTDQTLHRELYIPTVDKTYSLTEMPFTGAGGIVYQLAIYRDITQRKQREESLRKSVADYQSLFEHVGCGVFISSKGGKFIDVNHALLDMLGYDNKDEFLTIDITKDLYRRPEDRQRFMEMIDREGAVIDYEVEFKRRDGTPISVLLTGHVRYDKDGNIIGYEGINVDQSQRKQMEKELQEAHDLLNRVVQSSPNPIMAADMKGNLIIWNQAAEETLGYPAGEVIGKMHITQIYPDGMAYDVMRMLRSSQYGGKGRLRSYPMNYIRRDGQMIEGTQSAAIIYDARGNELASVGIFVDLEERLSMERQLRQTQAQLLQSEKLAAMGRLTSQIAHELNNPLYGIMNTLELVKTEIPPENRRRKILDMALSETERLAELLRKMLTFSKPDQEEWQPVDFNEILDEILLLHEKQLQECSIKIATDFDPELARVFASKNQMRQVILNLISNARDAMPEGGTLSVTTRNRDSSIHVAVSDTGIGVKEENISKIFDAFFTTKGAVKGVGLGLSVCYGFIKDHGGDILVESKLDSGTTFTIVLPMHVYSEDADGPENQVAE